MIFLRNKGALSSPVSLAAGTTVIPFDTVVCNTNDSTTWNSANNSVVMENIGRYNAKCTVVLTSTLASEASIQLLSNGTAIQGDFVEASISAQGEATLTLDVPIQVTATSGSDAYLQWSITVTEAASMVNAFADIQGIR